MYLNKELLSAYVAARPGWFSTSFTPNTYSFGHLARDIIGLQNRYVLRATCIASVERDPMLAIQVAEK